MNKPPKFQQWMKKTASAGIRQGIKFVQRRIPYDHHNPFLDGIFTPQRQEHYSEQLRVEGSIPEELDGALMRIGPNPLQVDNPKLYHWFVGDGMVHAMRLRNGKACWYKSRYVGADNVQKKLKRPKIAGESRGVSDAVNTNIIAFAGKIWALVEAGSLPIELDADLESKRHQLLQDQADFPFTAHPHTDPETGDIHAVCYDALNREQIFYLHFDPQGRLKHHTAIAVQDGPMIHDCAITQSHVLIMDLNVTFSLHNAIRGASLPYQWNPEHLANIGILPFGGTEQDIRWYPIDPCFIFHTANAFEMENGDIVMDAVVHDKMMVRSIQGPIEEQNICLERFVFEKDSGQVKRTMLSQQKQEFPRINERYIGRPYRYIYSISFGEFDKPEQVSSNQLLCHDLESGTLQRYNFDENTVIGEAVFVEREHAQAENDGWLMAYVHALDCSPSRVMIFDAQDVQKGPAAVIHLPVRVPIGFHCNWIDYRQLR